MTDAPAAARFTLWQRGLHWLMFLLVAVAYLLIELREDAPRGSALRTNLLQSHVLAGLAVLLLIWPRIWQKLRRGSPPITPPLQRWQTQLSALTHFALYAFLLFQPVLGVLTIWMAGRGLPIFLTGLEIPSPFVGSHEWHEWFEGIHKQLGNVFYWMIGLHIAAACYHHFLRRDDSLRRLL